MYLTFNYLTFNYIFDLIIQNYIISFIIIVIITYLTQESVNKNAEKKLWDKEIQRELAEHREIHAANREIQTKNYENELQIWKDINRK